MRITTSARFYTKPETLPTIHRHSGIAMMTPEQVHYGRAGLVHERRSKVWAEVFNAHPERFMKGMPTAKMIPAAVWINPPAHDPTSDQGGH